MKTAILLAPILALAPLPAVAQDATSATTQQSTTSGPTRESIREAVRDVTRDTTPNAARTTTQTTISETAPAAGAAASKADTKVLTGSYLREVDDSEPLLGPGNMTVRQMEDAAIADANGKRVGDVEEVIANNRGQIVGLTAEVGGFLGMGDKEVLIPLEQLTVQNGQFRTKLTVEQLKALPSWDED